jgi:protein phosphatase
MSDLALRVGAVSNQGLRSNNEDRLLIDLQKGLFLVADGMGGQEAGELASGLAVEVIPRVLEKSLSANESADRALLGAMAEANQAIIDAGSSQPLGRRMGTTAVCALKSNGQLFVTNMGDSRAYLIRGDKAEQLTIDHTVAAALVACGALTAEEALTSPFNNRLYKFLGCTETHETADLKPLTPQAGDWLLLATDGLTNFVSGEDLLAGPSKFHNPQTWAEHLVKTALERGSRDNVTCIVVAFEEAKS